MRALGVSLTEQLGWIEGYLSLLDVLGLYSPAAAVRAACYKVGLSRGSSRNGSDLSALTAVHTERRAVHTARRRYTLRGVLYTLRDGCTH